MELCYNNWSPGGHQGDTAAPRAYNFAREARRFTPTANLACPIR